nr:FliG C-terminal domain-containing protein [Maritimibacter sp. DP1N21-5]
MTLAGGGLTDLSGLDVGGSSITPASAVRRVELTKKQKAAVIVRLLLAEGVELKLSDLPEELQTELAHQMSTMRFIDRLTLKSVVDEFVTEIESIGLAFPGGLEGALNVLDGTISPSTAARIRKAQGFVFTGDPWETIAGLDPARLLPVLEEESAEVGAVLLSKLKVSVAADLLGRIPGPRARKLAYAISLTGGVDPAVVARIGRALAAQLDAQPARAFASGPVERVGAILNFATGSIREDVLTGLDEEDAAFAEEVRKSIFTFANIPDRIDARDIPKITRDVDQAVLITALAGATGTLEKVSNFILESISKRMADQFREEMSNLGKVKPKDAEEAMGAIVAAIRALEASGEIMLLSGEDD